MKIKNDFVTNSSSTSFLLISNDKITKDSFLDFLGIYSDSPIYKLGEELYENIVRGLETIEDEYLNHKKKFPTIKDYITTEFSDEALQKYTLAKEKGINVYVGSLGSDEGDLSAFMCLDHFTEESETYYIHYTNCYW